MKKEIVLAIVLGFTIGLIITFGIYTAQKALQQQAHPPSSKTEQSSPPPQPLTSTNLLISSPQHETISNQETIEIVGTASPQAHIVILTATSEYITQADANGHFTQPIELEGGANTIKIISIDQQNEETTKEISVIFSTANFEEVTATSSAQTEESEDSNE